MEKQQSQRTTKDWLRTENWYLKQKEIEIEKERLTIKERLQKLQNSYCIDK